MTAVVELSSLTRRYGGPPETVALRDCTLSIQEGDFVTVVGPSGSGKSTLLNLVGLLDRPTSGSYLLRGENVLTMSESLRAATRATVIGFVFQSFQLLETRTCLENVMLADLYAGVPASLSRDRAMASLAAVGLSAKAESTPSYLSGGERQRVAIARALVGDPAILLCDEPTGNLDSGNAQSILALLDSLNQGGATIMLITHDLQIARRGTRLVSILDGCVSELTPRELRQ